MSAWLHRVTVLARRSTGTLYGPQSQINWSSAHSMPQARNLHHPVISRRPARGAEWYHDRAGSSGRSQASAGGKSLDPNIWTKHTDKICGLIDDPPAPAFLKSLHAIAGKHGVSPSAIALAWYARAKSGATPLASARNTGQFSSLFESTLVDLDEDDQRMLVW